MAGCTVVTSFVHGPAWHGGARGGACRPGRCRQRPARGAQRPLSHARSPRGTLRLDFRSRQRGREALVGPRLRPGSGARLGGPSRGPRKGPCALPPCRASRTLPSCRGPRVGLLCARNGVGHAQGKRASTASLISPAVGAINSQNLPPRSS